MNRKAWTLALALAFAGPLLAQDDDLDKRVADEITKYDTDQDGKVTKAEYRAVVKQDGGFEDEAKYEWLEKWKFSLIDFLAADSDDNLEINNAELLAYYTRVNDKNAEKFGTLSNKDITELDNEYLEPIVKWMLDTFDTDKNGKISQQEADAQKIPDVVKQYDTNKDGNLDAMEIKVSEVKPLESVYDVEKGYKLKGEPSVAEPAEIPERVRKEFESVDTNKDGSISKEEMKTARMKGQTNKAHWWGVYIGFLAMDTDDDISVTLAEFASYVRDEMDGLGHKFYPKDREEAMNEIWGEVDGDKDGKITSAEWDKLFPGNKEFAGLDADSSGDVSKDELWDAFKGELKGFEFPEKDKDAGATTDNGGTTDAADPVWKHYQKVGRTWTHKNVSNFMNTETVSYIKYEVTKVAADHAMVKMTMLDKDKKPFAGMSPSEIKVEFKIVKPDPDAPNPPKVNDLGLEKVKVEAGEIECQVTETVMTIAGATYTTKAWMHKQYPGLGVKTETTSEGMTSSSELVEFTE